MLDLPPIDQEPVQDPQKPAQPANPYDSVVKEMAAQAVPQGPPQAPEEQAPDYGAAVAQMQKSREGALQVQFATALKTDPDARAVAQRLAKQMGAPDSVDAIERNPEVAKAFAAQKQFDAQTLMRANPVLAESMSDLEFARLAHDDLAALSWGEKIAANYRVGELTNERGFLGERLRAGVASDTEKQKLIDLGVEMSHLPQASDGLGTGLAKSLGQMLPMMWDAGKVGIVAGGATAATVGLVGLAVPVVGEIGAIGAGIAAGGGAFTGSLAMQTYAVEAGNAYLDMREMGINHDEASNASFWVGVGNAALEVVGEELLFGVGGFLARTDVKSIVKPVSKALVKPTFGQAVARFTARTALGVTGEVVTEVAQEWVNIVAERMALDSTVRQSVENAGLLARPNTGRDRELFGDNTASLLKTFDTAPDVADRLLTIAGETLRGTLLLGALRPAIRFGVEAAGVTQAARTAKFFTDLSKASSASALRARAPDRYAQFVASTMADSDAETTYVKATKFEELRKQSGLSDAQLEEALPGVLKQLQDDAAANAGGDVQFPTARFASHVADTALGKALLEHMRLSPGAASLADAQASFRETLKKSEEMQAELLKTEEQRTAFRESADRVEQDILKQLRATGVYSDEKARFMAKLHRLQSEMLALRSGPKPTTDGGVPSVVMPEEMHTLIVERAQQAAAAAADPSAPVAPAAPSLDQFAGLKSQRANLFDFARAKKMLAEGSSPEEARINTGWFRGADGFWRYEISDHNASFIDPVPPRSTKKRPVSAAQRARARLTALEGVRLDQVLDHPSLFDAYPFLRETTVQIVPGLRNRGGVTASGTIVMRGELSAKEKLSVLLHELQHKIQDYEGFARGGVSREFTIEELRKLAQEDLASLRATLQQTHPEDLTLFDRFLAAREAFRTERTSDVATNYLTVDRETQDNENVHKLVIAHDAANGSGLDAFQAYLRLAGEVEARNTQTRAGMSYAARDAASPSSTADTPSEKLIIKFNDATVKAAEESARAGVGSPAFRAWMGNSPTTTDEQGNPIMFYRGLRRVPKPDEMRTTQGRATLSFTTDPEVANVYAHQLKPFEEPKLGGGSTVMPAFLTMKKPLDLRNLDEHVTLWDVIGDHLNWDLRADPAEGSVDYSLIAGALRTLDTTVSRDQAKVEFNDAEHDGEMIESFDELADAIEMLGEDGKADDIEALLSTVSLDTYALADDENFVEMLMGQGFDGIIHQDVFEAGMPYYKGDPSKMVEGVDGNPVVTTWRPFSLRQVKSPMNEGTFSPETSNVLKQNQTTLVPSTKDAVANYDLHEAPTREIAFEDTPKAKAALAKNVALFGQHLFEVKLKDKDGNPYTGIMRAYDSIVPAGDTPEAQANSIIGQMQRNVMAILRRSIEKFGPQLIARSKLWYVGANRIAQAFAKRYNISLSQAAAMLAVMSPQADWRQNVSYVERVLDVIAGRWDYTWDEKMSAWADEWLQSKTQVKSRATEATRLADSAKAARADLKKASRTLEKLRLSTATDVPAAEAAVTGAEDMLDELHAQTVAARKTARTEKTKEAQAAAKAAEKAEAKQNDAAVEARAKLRELRKLVPAQEREVAKATSHAALREQKAAEEHEHLAVQPKIRGKKLSELTTDYERAWFIRVYDEVYHSRTFREITPEGGMLGVVTSAGDEDADMGWKGYGTIAKAVSIYFDGSRENIDEQLGGEHKVRNFYNNIFSPNVNLPFGTVDTHQVAANLILPLGSKALEVNQNFGSDGAGNYGPRGLYGPYWMYVEALRGALAEVNADPELSKLGLQFVREMQSISWEAVKGLFAPRFKTPENENKVRDLWAAYHAGSATYDETIDKIIETAGGLQAPFWFGQEPDRAAAFEDGAASYEGGVSAPRQGHVRRIDAGRGNAGNAGQDVPRGGAGSGTESLQQLDLDEALVAVHKIGEEELESAIELGGLAAPSIAVAKLSTLYEGFGEVVLIGNKNLVDPAKTPVFDSDIYSPTFPHIEQGGFSKKTARSITKHIRSLLTDDDRELLEGKHADPDMVHSRVYAGFEEYLQKHNADAVVNEIYDPRRAAVQLAYLREIGDKRPAPRIYPATGIERRTGATREQLDALKPHLPELEAAVRTLQGRSTPAQDAQAEEVIRRLAVTLMPAAADPVRTFGLDQPHMLYLLGADLRDYLAGVTGRPMIDKEILSTRVRDAKAAMDPTPGGWIRGLLEPHKHELKRFVYIGAKRAPATLDNIVEAMGKQLRNSGPGFHAGGANVRAALARQFQSFAELQAARAQVVGTKAHGVARRTVTKPVVDRFFDALASGSQFTPEVQDVFYKPENAHTDPLWRESFWRVLAEGPTNEKEMRAALKKFGFNIDQPKAVADELIQAGLAAVKAIVDTPQDYFEAKPLRPVALAEFEGALVPFNSPARLVSALQAAGLRVAGYDQFKHHTATAKAVRDLALQIESESGAVLGNGPVLFAGGQRAEYIPALRKMLLKKGTSDPSSFVHELGHHVLEMFIDLASKPGAVPQLRSDVTGILNWLGVRSIEDWQSMTFEQRRPFHEAWAYSNEIYMAEGIAPTQKLQTLFDKFAAWLREVYTSIVTELNDTYKKAFGRDLPALTPEVRAFMGRMLASDEAIAHAELVRGMVPAFQDQASSGMNDQEWAEYQVALQEARDAAVTDLTRASIKQTQWIKAESLRVMRALKRMHKDMRDEMEEEIAPEVLARRVHVAQEKLREGTYTGGDLQPRRLQLNEKQTLEMLPEPLRGIAADTFKRGPNGMLAKDGLPPETVAEMLGYDSADQMLRELLATPDASKVIDNEVDAAMLEEYGDLNSKEALDRAVTLALHNEARGRFLAIEQRFLERAGAPTRVTIGASREAARRTMLKTKLLNISSHKHEVAEARASRAVQQAAREGKAEDALVAHRTQTLQSALARVAAEAEDEIDKTLRGFKRFFKPISKIAKSRVTDFVLAGRAILAAHGIGDAPTSDAGPMPATAWLDKVADYNPQLAKMLRPVVDRHSGGNVPYQQLTLEEFRGLKAGLDALWEQAKAQRELAVEDRTAAIEAVVTDLQADLTRHPQTPARTEARSESQRNWGDFLGIGSALRRVESWADAMGDSWTKWIWRPVSNAVTKYRRSLAAHVKRYVATVEKLQLKPGKIAAPTLNWTFGNSNGGVGIAELLGAMLHTGNEGNLRKNLLGRAWATEDENQELDTKKWDEFVQRMIKEGTLTVDHFDWLQATWDHMEQIKPLLQQAHYQLYGFFFDEVEAKPFTVQFPDGTSRSYRGGYVPAKLDPDDPRAIEFTTMDELESDWRQSIPSTGKGFTVTRTAAIRPLSHDIHLIPQHLNETLRFAHVQPAIAGVLRVLNNKDLQRDLAAVDPSARDYLIKWLQASARQSTGQPGVSRGVDKIARAVRRRTGMSALAISVSNAVQNFTGWFPALLKVPTRHLFHGFWHHMGDRESTEKIAGLSEFMADYMGQEIRELADTLRELTHNRSAWTKLTSWAEGHAPILSKMTQSVVSKTTWIGTFNREIEAGVPQAEAVQRADAAVRLTQGGNRPEDVPQYERSTPVVQALTQFSSYFNMLGNLNVTELKKARRDLLGGERAGRYGMVYLFGFLAPMLVADAIARAAAMQGDSDDDGWGDEFTDWFFGGQLRGALSFVPGAGPTVSSFVRSVFTDSVADDRMSLAPVFRALEASSTGMNAAAHQLFDHGYLKAKNVRDLGTFLTMLTGLPFTAITRPLSMLAPQR